MPDLKELNNVMVNLFRTRSMTLQGDSPSKQATAKALEKSVRLAIDEGEIIHTGLIFTHAGNGTLMSEDESSAVLTYVAQRRDILNVFSFEADQAAAEEAEADDPEEEAIPQLEPEPSVD